MAHIDYNFVTGGGRYLCVIGGSEGAPVNMAAIRGGREDLPAVTVLWHPASGDGGRKGFLAVFRLPDDAGPAAFRELVLGPDTARLRPQDVTKDFALMVAHCPDTVFVDYLWAVATGKLPPPAAAELAELRARLNRKIAGYVENPATAVAVDIAMLTPAGKGLARGWALSQREIAEPPVALLMGQGFLRPFPILPNAMPRPDIASEYSERYRITGMDGFCGSFDLGGPATGPVQVLAIARDPEGGSLAGRAAELCAASAYARLAVVMKSQMPAPERLRLVEHQVAYAAPATGPRPDPAGALQIRLVLDHDAADLSLRDALRIITGWIPDNIRIQVVREHPTRHLTEAVAGAIGEAGEHWRGRIEIIPRFDVAAAREDADVVVLARSSAFFLFDKLPDIAADLARSDRGSVVHLYDAALALSPDMADRKRLMRAFVEFSPPFLAAIPAAALPNTFRNLTELFLTVEGQMRAVIWALADGIDYTLVLSDAAFEGARAPASEFMVNTRDVESYDATVLAELAAANPPP